jgi:hypothetical protein
MHSRREKIASAVFGGLAIFILLLVFVGSEPPAVYALVFAIAMSFEAFALAAAPPVLFEQVSFSQLRHGRGPFRYGFAALLSVAAKVCFLFAAISWVFAHAEL